MKRARVPATLALAFTLITLPWGAPHAALAGGNEPAASTGEQPAPATAQTQSAIEPQAESTFLPEQTLYETVPPHTQLDFPMDAVAAPQSVDGTVPMFRHADEDSEVLMEYYSGARLTALHPAGSGFWKVQAGVKGAGIMGYMRAEDLRFGTSAQREVTVCFMELRFNQDAPVYAYRDTGSKVIGICDTEHTYYAMSRTDDKWVQLFLPPLPHAAEQEERLTEGFVYMETGLGHGYFHQRVSDYTSDASSWTVDPLPGEMTREGAIAYAVELLASQSEINLDHLAILLEEGYPAEFFDAQSLREMQSSAALVHYDWNRADGETWRRWQVFFWSDLDEGVMWVTIDNINGQGERSYYYHYLESESYDNSTVDIVL